MSTRILADGYDTAEVARKLDHHGSGDRQARGEVGRAAVEQLAQAVRRLPRPMGGTTASLEFDLSQVEQWLRNPGQGSPGCSEPTDSGGTSPVAKESRAAAFASIGSTCWRGNAASDQLPGRSTSNSPTCSRGRRLGRRAGSAGRLRRAVAGLLRPRPGSPLATPDDLADLMARLADVGGGAVLDPAAGTGAALRAAVRAGCTAPYGQEFDEDLAKLAELWLARREVPGEVRPSDSLRADASPCRRHPDL